MKHLNKIIQMSLKRKLLKAKSIFIEYKWDIISFLIISLIISIIGFHLNAWTGDLKGDDAYLHAGWIQYILDNFPHINWYHQFYIGYPPFNFDVPTYYLLIALFNKITTLSVILLIQITMWLSMIALGLSAYILARVLKFQRLPALGFSLLMFTMDITWNYLVIGGAYNRIIALPFVFISIALAYSHVRNINESVKNTKIYVASVVVFTILALLHPLIWQWTFVFISGIYLIGINDWKQKLLNIIKTILPVALLSVWLYLPLFRAYGASLSSPAGGTANDTTLMQFHWLIYLPSRFVWSIDLGPLILPLALLGLLFTGIYYKRIISHRNQIKLELKIIICFFALCTYFFAYGWLPMPKSTYLMAAYDYALWFGISLIILSLFTFSMLLQTKVFQNFGKYIKTFFKIAFLPATVAVCFIIMPFLQSFISMQNPDNVNSLPSSINQIVEIAKTNSGVDFRLQNDQRRLTSPFYVADSNATITGGRGSYIPNKYYSQWANASVSYRISSDNRSNIYFEDLPQVWRSNIDGEQNYYSPMFWLDWYGASGPILMPSIYPQEQNSQNYNSRPQIFQQYVAHTKFGDMFFYKYPDSSPITVSTQTETIALPFQSGDSPSFYANFLDVLSSLNLNSQWIIPIKLDNENNLRKFSNALVDYNDYVTHEKILDNYVMNGGHLIVTGAYNNPQNLLNVNINDIGLSFHVEASILAAPQGSVILAQTQEGPVAYRTSVGQGNITEIGITLAAMLKSDSLGDTILLTEAVAPELNLDKIVAKLDSSSISYVTQGTVGGISMFSDDPKQKITASNWAMSGNTDKGQVQVKSSAEIENMTAEFNGMNTNNQVNFSADLSDITFVKSSGSVEFDIWTDSTPIIDASFASPDQTKYNNHPVQTKKGEWVHNILPLSAFNYPTGDFDTSQKFIFAVNNNPSTGLSGHEVVVNLRVKNFIINSPDQLVSSGVPSLNFVADHSIEHNQINWTFRLSQSVSADSNAIVRFSLWSDGSISSIGVTLNQTGNSGYLYYDLPDEIWTGWKDFVLPLSYFRRKEGEGINSVDAISLIFNENAPYQSQAEIQRFKIANVGIVAMNNPSRYVGLNGTWTQANKFVLPLGDKKNILWKESYLPSWLVKDNLGRKVDYYFAGPGMIYLVAPQDATSLTFEMPVPKDLAAGIVISTFSLFGFIAYLIVKHRTRQQPN
jgi:hypothetical protein